MVRNFSHRRFAGITNSCPQLRFSEVFVDRFVEVYLSFLHEEHQTRRSERL
jgi:hypothetical protein